VTSVEVRQTGVPRVTNYQPFQRKKNVQKETKQKSLFERLRESLSPTETRTSKEEGKVVQNVDRTLVIGVHGWAILGGLMTGSPRAVSEELADYLSDALKKQNITKIEVLHIYGHGTIIQRVKAHLQFLALEENRLLLSSCKNIFFSCHSQGCVVGCLLLKELFDLGWISSEKNINFLALAGVHHGCFQNLPSDYFSNTKELFILSQPDNSLSNQHLSALAELLRHGAKIFLMACFLDEVVPLHSALAVGLGVHPNLRRSVYAGAKMNNESNDFILDLFELLCRCQTTGIQIDLLPHLSGFFRGRFYQIDIGQNHSNIRLEPQVFNAAAAFFTSFSKRNIIEVVPFRFSSVWWSSILTNSFYGSDLNNYFLKQRIKGLFDVSQQFEITKELANLRLSFREWRPNQEGEKHLRRTFEAFFPEGKL